MTALRKHNPPPRMTVDEFLAWWDEQAGDQRYELANGEVFAMSREAIGHARLKFAATLAFREGIRKAGLPCEAIIDGPGVKIENHSYFVPDVIVFCGTIADETQSFVEEPIIVVEVLSPGTKVFDVEEKLGYYLSKPSIQQYLIIDGKNRRAIHHRRTGEAKAESVVVREGAIRLDPPGFEIALVDVFNGAVPG